MFERFTDRARRVVVLAQEEARMLNHNYIGTEHMLLGLIHEGEGVGALALTSLGVGLQQVRDHVEKVIGQGQQAPTGHIPFTPRAKKVMELGLREALQLGHNYVGTEHILLGLIREGEGVGAQTLVKFGAELTRVRQQVIQLLSGPSAPETPWVRTDAARRTAIEVTEGLRTTIDAVRGITEQIAKFGWQIENLKALAASNSLPDTLAVIDSQIAMVRRAKEAAINNQAFDEAMQWREQEKTLVIQRKALRDELNKPTRHVSEVETGLSDEAFAEFQRQLRYEVTDPFGATKLYPLLWDGPRLKGIDWAHGS